MAAITKQQSQGSGFFHATNYNFPEDWVEYTKAFPIMPGKGSIVGRVLLEGKALQSADVFADPEYTFLAPATKAGYRTLLGVPLLREGNPIGVLNLGRRTVAPFTQKQIELVQTFADQAVIAIENVRLFDEVQARTNQLTESLEQQTATSDVLGVISSSPGDLAPVFAKVLESATQICGAHFGILNLYEEPAFRNVAHHNMPERALSKWLGGAFVPHPASGLGQIARKKQTVHIADLRQGRAYQEGDPAVVGLSDGTGARTLLLAPMVKDGRLIGTIGIYRQEVRPFTDNQVELVENFAKQAVIAIENARLLSELREALEQQTATSDVLEIISSSPGNLEPVFEKILESATRICGAQFGLTVSYEGDGCYRETAMHNAPDAFKDLLRRDAVIRPPPNGPLGVLTATKQIVHMVDMREEQAYKDRARETVRLVELAGVRTILLVPMLKDNELIGAITIYRQEVKAFSEKQIELVNNFASQAVIAIENVRLLNELRERTADLSESLEQQTATSDVLKVISSSQGELTPVFDTILANAMRVCSAQFGNLFLREGDICRAVSAVGEQSYVDQWRRNPTLDLNEHPNTPLSRVAASRTALHISDLTKDISFIERIPRIVALVETAGARAFVVVPMLKEGEFVGAIAMYRQVEVPFSNKQIALVENFASQAVIAIENTRLLSELRARTDELAHSVEELRALGDVSQTVNSTLDLETVLTTIVGRAVQLSRTDAGAIYVFDEARQEFSLHATHGMSEAMTAALSGRHIGLDQANIGTAAVQRKPIQVPDLTKDAPSPVNDIILKEGFRSLLIIPLLRPDQIVGALVVRRKTPGEFSRPTIDLLQTFADQSVVAIHNARLFERVETRTRELATSLEDLRTAQDRLVQTEKLASLGQLTAGIAHEIKNPLNFVNNFSTLSVELIHELREALAGAKLDTKLRAEISEIADTLRANLDKIEQHGRRADSIVKNMLLHSRQGSSEHRPVDINALVEESLNLAYHGARAETQDFNITLEKSFDPAAGEADLFPQEVTRVLLNLISNGFYAATKRQAEANGGDFEPVLKATTKSLGDRVEIRIRDNGTGIPPEVKDKMFNPFFTTKPAGEGTGLGLSISHDIIVKQHGGSIEVDTQSGEFTEFRIVLPRAGLALTTSGGRA